MSPVISRFEAKARLAARSARACLCVCGCGPPDDIYCIRVVVREAPDVVVGQAFVRLLRAEDDEDAFEEGLTDENGEAVFFPLPEDGDWWVEVFADWCLPEPQVVQCTVLENAVTEVPVFVTRVRYYLHTDADRDGQIDAAPPVIGAAPEWKWGAEGAGAIVLCNSDNDVVPPAPAVAPVVAPRAQPPARAAAGDPSRAVDTAAVAAAVAARANLIAPANNRGDDVVNPGNDGTHELAPFAIRPYSTVAVPDVPADASRWRLKLEIVRDANRVRIFDNNQPGSQRVLGATADDVPVSFKEFPIRVVPANGGDATRLPVTRFWMEATSYPASDFDGVVELKLTAKMRSWIPGKGDISYFTGARFRVAPWLLPHSGEPVSTFYISDLGDERVRIAPYKLPGNGALRFELDGILAAAGNPRYVEFPAQDPWMQDCMKIGYSVAPCGVAPEYRHRTEVVMEAFRNSSAIDLSPYPRSLVAGDVGFVNPTQVSKERSS